MVALYKAAARRFRDCHDVDEVIVREGCEHEVGLLREVDSLFEISGETLTLLFFEQLAAKFSLAVLSMSEYHNETEVDIHYISAIHLSISHEARERIFKREDWSECLTTAVEFIHLICFLRMVEQNEIDVWANSGDLESETIALEGSSRFTHLSLLLHILYIELVGLDIEEEEVRVVELDLIEPNPVRSCYF